MIPKNDMEKWLRIEERAIHELRSSGYQWRGVGAFSQVFCFLILPSFSAATAYSFSVRGEPLNGTRFYCVRSTWDRQYDQGRYESSLRTKANMEPTLSRTLVRLTDDFAKSMQEQIEEISVPLFVQSGIQLDGTSYEFSNRQVTLTWNESFPKKWLPLVEAMQKFVRCVDDVANESDNE